MRQLPRSALCFLLLPGVWTSSGTIVAATTVEHRREAPDFAAVVRGVRPRGFGAIPYVPSSPTAGGMVLYVATSGSDGNAGTSSAPFRTINKAAQVARAGDVVTIRSGTYSGSVVVRNSGTASAPIVFQAETRGGVVLTDGHATFRPAEWGGGVQQTGQLYIAVRGLVFRGYADTASAPPGPSFPAAVKAARGWRIEDCLFDRAGRSALAIAGSDVVVERSTFQYNYVYAMTAWAPARGAESPGDPRYVPLENIRLVDLVLRGNHTDQALQEAALAAYVAKFTTTRGTVIDNMESYENNGPGFWLDSRNTDYVVRNSYFHHNRNFGGERSRSGRGLHIEINWASGLIENNVFADNQGTAVGITNSQGVRIRRNLMVGNLQCVTLINANRGRTASGRPLFPASDIAIHRNYCKDWRLTGAIHSWGGTFRMPRAMNIVADSNVYHPGPSRTLAWWQTTGGVTSLSAARLQLGWEPNGRLGVIAWP